MKCINNCEFQKFNTGKFYCTFYKNRELNTLKSEGSGTIEVYRCKECIEDGLIGNNSLDEKLRKIKKYIGEFADDFYSYKDDFENTFTNVYRIIKEMENMDEKDNMDEDKEDE